MSVQERQMILEREGAAGVDATRRWFELSVVQRALLANTLSLVEMSIVTEKLAKARQGEKRA